MNRVKARIGLTCFMTNYAEFQTDKLEGFIGFIIERDLVPAIFECREVANIIPGDLFLDVFSVRSGRKLEIF